MPATGGTVANMLVLPDRRYEMNMMTLRYSLILVSISLLVAFAGSLIFVSVIPVLIMLSLMAIMVILECWYIFLTVRGSQPEQTGPPGTQRNVVLILGPYAEKWFRETQHNSALLSGETTYLLISDPYALTRRLRDINDHTPGASIITFFPFLPDGHESGSMITEALLRWQGQFAGITAHLKLPCVVGIYARLSTELRSNSRQNATWINVENQNPHQTVTFTSLIQILQDQLGRQPVLTAHDTQRAVMGDELIRWLEEKGLAEIMSSIFNAPPLQICNLRLCDYGNGFNRHGAWSRWLESKYALLPGLGKTITLPPLPSLKNHVIDTGAQACPAATPLKRPRFIWSMGLVMFLLSLHLLSTGWHINKQKQLFYWQVRHLDRLEDMSLKTLQQRFQTLDRVKKEWDECLAISPIRTWNLSLCRDFISKLEERLAIMKAIPTLSTHNATAVFDSGSARLLPDAILVLKEIESLVKAYPDNKILIVGHSDNTGSKDINLTLSAQRAENIRNWLIQRGIHSSRLQTRASGTSEPVASNNTVEGRQKNRRVEIIVLPAAINKKEF
jgi:outer membrane protein OmpA-like peptidoglycan-associated protein